jgi:hypothetical protein
VGVKAVKGVLPLRQDVPKLRVPPPLVLSGAPRLSVGGNVRLIDKGCALSCCSASAGKVTTPTKRVTHRAPRPERYFWQLMLKISPSKIIELILKIDFQDKLLSAKLTTNNENPF